MGCLQHIPTYIKQLQCFTVFIDFVTENIWDWRASGQSRLGNQILKIKKPFVLECLIQSHVPSKLSVHLNPDGRGLKIMLAKTSISYKIVTSRSKLLERFPTFKGRDSSKLFEYKPEVTDISEINKQQHHQTWPNNILKWPKTKDFSTHSAELRIWEMDQLVQFNLLLWSFPLKTNIVLLYLLPTITIYR